MSDHTPPEAVVFDVGGVLVDHDNEHLVRTLASRCETPDARRVAELFLDPAYDRGAKPVSDLHQRLRRELGYGRDWPGFLQDWCCHLVVNEGMLSFAEALSRRVRVMLFSNTSREHWDHLVEASNGRLAAYEAYLSFELGRAKPDRAAFDKVIAESGVAPAATLFVDDRPENVAAAESVGLRGHVFTGAVPLAERLGPLAPTGA